MILALTSYPKLHVPDTGFSAQDKVAHLAMYFVLGFFTSRALWLGKQMTVSQAMVRSILFCCVFAIMDEWHQYFIPGRDAEFLDGIANVGGVFTAQILFLKYAKYYVARDSKKISTKAIEECNIEAE